MSMLPLALLIDSRDYLFFLASIAVLASCVTASIFMLAFPNLRPPLSLCTRVHAVVFLLSTAATSMLLAFSLAFDTPVLNIGDNQGSVSWTITITVLVQCYSLLGFLYFQMRDLIRILDDRARDRRGDA